MLCAQGQGQSAPFGVGLERMNMMFIHLLFHVPCFLDKAHHSLVTTLVEPIKVMIFDHSKIVKSLFINWISGDGCFFTFVICAGGRHESVFEVCNKSLIILKFNH